jgi:hypothetical protein
MSNTGITIDGLADLLKAIRDLPQQLNEAVSPLIWYDGLRTGFGLGLALGLSLWMFSNSIKQGK